MLKVSPEMKILKPQLLESFQKRLLFSKKDTTLNKLYSENEKRYLMTMIPKPRADSVMLTHLISNYL